MGNGFLVGQTSADQVVYHRVTDRQGDSHHPYRRVLTNDDCSGLPPAGPGSSRRLAGRWWIAQHPPRLGVRK